MSKYTAENAFSELDNAETILLQKVEKHLEHSEPYEVAKILTLVNRELYRIDEDARTLRLTGELDHDIYTAMSKTYHDIARRIMQLAYDYKLGHEVSVFHKSLRLARRLTRISQSI
jgi:hypothetical protein